MFDRFENRAKEVVAVAQDEARNLNANAISVEHILLGMLNEPEDDIAGTSLIEEDITLEALRAFLSKKSPGKTHAATDSLPFSSPCKKSLELALREALALGAKSIRSEHILLGILRENDPIIAEIFDNFNVDANKLRETIVEKINAGGRERELVGAGGGGGSELRRKTMATRNLAKCARNLTEMAREKKLDPMVGREVEVQRMMQILTRRTKNNPVLVGHPGVGKTSIVEGLAQKIVDGDVPARLEKKEIWSLDLASIVAGTKYRGEFEERLKGIVKEIVANKNIIVFIDEVHTLMGAGAAEGALSAGNILKPVLARGELQTIGATTFDEYKKYLEKDKALERRFQKITVEPPSVEDTIKILEGLRDTYQEHHSVRFTDEALKSSAELSDRYINDRYLPDKAIDLMDEAASHVYMTSVGTGKAQEIIDELHEIKEKKEQAIEEEQFQTAYHHSLREKELQLERREAVKVNEKDEENWPLVTVADVAQVVAMWTGVQVGRLTIEETTRLKEMEAELHNRVISQEPAIVAVSKSIRRSKAGLHEADQPLGSFLFLGPSGVGKTELGKALAEFLFGEEKALIRIDMSEYAEKHNVSRLLGSPPGYVGHDEGGQLTEKVRQKPYSVVLLDEIEKAHPDVWNILLQLLDEGELTDGGGRVVNFRNTVVIMTSNVGSEMITASQHGLGFGVRDDAASYDNMRKAVLEKCKKVFPPELRNRIDETVVFSKLSKEDIKEIIDLLLHRLEKLLGDKGLTLKLTDAAKELIIEEGYDPAMGARPLKRALRRFVEEPLADHMLGVLKEGSIVKVTVSPDNEKETQIEIVAPKRKAKRKESDPELVPVAQ